MVVGQLFSFEKFLPLIKSYPLPSDQIAMLIAGLIVTSEVFALPFLLRMPVSLLMRWFSLVCSLFAAGIWLVLVIIILTTTNNLDNSGMFGTKLVIPAGTMQLAVAVIMSVLAVVSAIGLRPSARSRKK